MTCDIKANFKRKYTYIHTCIHTYTGKDFQLSVKVRNIVQNKPIAILEICAHEYIDEQNLIFEDVHVNEHEKNSLSFQIKQLYNKKIYMDGIITVMLPIPMYKEYRRNLRKKLN